ncbi:hypothetical protein JNW91_03865 [Micromonospora sp. STR1_7]|uniref:Uncharacterized protein n=1 Tax=Micromonospora parastrephiae TaxID=2806101 RepID=A0ABS1XPA1_9ACTN|nr:hypothetical protein [Micromonospora parastrephiae]MBM0231086.1 hypothetical protein [Micromonospora parastrephiae]
MSEALLLGAWLVEFAASAVAMYTAATYRQSARPAVVMRTSRTAAGVAVLMLAGLAIWALLTLAR